MKLWIRTGLSFLLAVMFSLTGPWGAGTARAGDFGKGPLPDWVHLAPVLPSPPDYVRQAGGGSFADLLDDQYRFDGQRLVHFAREVVTVTDRAGIEALASQTRDFDPATESLSLVRVLVTRQGLQSDRLAATRTEVLRREASLEAGIVTGTLTVTIDIPDIQVGDQLELAFVWTMERPLPGAPFAALMYHDSFVPIGESRTSVLWPAGMPITIYPRGGADPAPEVRQRGPMTQYSWSLQRPQVLRAEEGSPWLRDGRRVIGFAEAADWGAVVAALAGHYGADYPLPAGWLAKLEAIRASHRDAEGQAIAVLRLVQEDIRYLSLSMGEGGYLARPPGEIIATGYGDCKDKALLLKVSLAVLGIAAEVALTDIDQGHSLPLWPPALWAFDHMILRAEIGGKPVWMDGTGIGQGGDFAHAVTPDYGFALPVSATGPARLQQIELTARDHWITDVTERFSFTPEGVRLVVQSIYEGAAADSRRQVIATEGAAQLTRSYADLYHESYPGIEATQEIAVLDDRAENRLRVEEFYFLPDAALEDHGLRDNFPLQAFDFAGFLPQGQTGARSSALWLGLPVRHRYQVIVSGAPVPLAAPDWVRLDNPAFSHAFRAIAPVRGSLYLLWEFQTKAREIPAGQVKAVMRDARRLGEATGFSWSLYPLDSLPEPSAD